MIQDIKEPRKIIVETKNEEKPESLSTKLENYAKVFSATMIPIVLAVGGWLIQQQLQNQSVKRDYVQLAVEILQEQDANKSNPALRAWAVQLLNYSSQVQIDQSLSELLVSGKAVLPMVGPGQIHASVRIVRQKLKDKTFATNLGANGRAITPLLRLSSDALGFFIDIFANDIDTHTFMDPEDLKDPDFARPQIELISMGLVAEQPEEPGVLKITELGLKARAVIKQCLRQKK